MLRTKMRLMLQENGERDQEEEPLPKCMVTNKKAQSPEGELSSSRWGFGFQSPKPSSFDSMVTISAES